MMKTAKTYAIVTLSGRRVIGDVVGIVKNGIIQCAGAVTIDGSPVNCFAVKLSLYQHHLDAALDLPRFKMLDKNDEVFVTNYFNTATYNTELV